MKIVFLLICVFLALAGVAGLPAPFELAEEDGLYGEPRRLAPKYSPNQLAKGIEMKNNKKQEENGRLTKRSPVAPLVELTSELLAKKDNKKHEENGRLTKRSPVAPLVELTSELLAVAPGVYSEYIGPNLSIKSKRDISKRSPSPFDLAEAEADPRKKREADPRKKRQVQPQKKREGDA